MSGYGHDCPRRSAFKSKTDMDEGLIAKSAGLPATAEPECGRRRIIPGQGFAADAHL